MLQYTTAVDVWSLGCIFAELLGMQRENCSKFENRAPLFPGSSCYPLSGDGIGRASQKQPYNLPQSMQVGNAETEGMRVDQLSVIFDIIGTPTEADLRDVESLSTPQLAQQLRGMDPKPATDLKTIFPGAEPAALDLLQSMLQFSPLKRISIDDALAHPFMADIRNVDVERLAGTSAHPLEVDAELALESAEKVLHNVVREVREMCEGSVDRSQAL